MVTTQLYTILGELYAYLTLSTLIPIRDVLFNAPRS